jgi:hypothetical protein
VTRFSEAYGSRLAAAPREVRPPAATREIRSFGDFQEDATLQCPTRDIFGEQRPLDDDRQRVVLVEATPESSQSARVCADEITGAPQQYTRAGFPHPALVHGELTNSRHRCKLRSRVAQVASQNSFRQQLPNMADALISRPFEFLQSQL